MEEGNSISGWFDATDKTNPKINLAFTFSGGDQQIVVLTEAWTILLRGLIDGLLTEVQKRKENFDGEHKDNKGIVERELRLSNKEKKNG